MFFVCDWDMVPTAKNHFPLPCCTCSELYFTLVILLHGCKNFKSVALIYIKYPMDEVQGSYTILMKMNG